MSDDELLDDDEIREFILEIDDLLNTKEEQYLSKLFFSDRTKHYCASDVKKIIRFQLLGCLRREVDIADDIAKHKKEEWLITDNSTVPKYD